MGAIVTNAPGAMIRALRWGRVSRLRALYTFMLYLMLPLVMLRLWVKGLRVSGYRHHWLERFGFCGLNPVSGVTWLHAVSVGEVRAAEPLIRALLAREAAGPLLVTTVTPTGRATVSKLFGEQVSCCYLPYDLPGAMRRFVDRVQPAMVIIMETEIWPNLYALLEERTIPLFLINARLSPSSLKGYLRFAGLSRPAVQGIEHIAVQSEQEARHFIQLGARDQQLSVVGNLKFDVHVPDDFEQRVSELVKNLGTGRRIWIAGSTHPGEERQLLEAHKRILDSCPNALLVVAPRHPERAGQIGSLCQQEALEFQFYRQAPPVTEAAQVVVVDTLGELVYFYGAASVAFVGGSLDGSGGHNPLEAILAGVPVVSGPSVYNFKSVFAELIEAGAVTVIESETALAERVCDWLGSNARRRAAVDAGLQVIDRNRGVVEKILRVIGER